MIVHVLLECAGSVKCHKSRMLQINTCTSVCGGCLYSLPDCSTVEQTQVTLQSVIWPHSHCYFNNYITWLLRNNWLCRNSYRVHKIRAKVARPSPAFSFSEFSDAGCVYRCVCVEDLGTRLATQLERFPNCVAECCPDYIHTQFGFSLDWEWLFISLLEIMEISHDLAEGLAN